MCVRVGGSACSTPVVQAVVHWHAGQGTLYASGMLPSGLMHMSVAQQFQVCAEFGIVGSSLHGQALRGFADTILAGSGITCRSNLVVGPVLHLAASWIRIQQIRIQQMGLMKLMSPQPVSRLLAHLTNTQCVCCIGAVLQTRAAPT